MLENKIDITKPNGALEFLYENAMNVQVQGTVKQITEHGELLAEARQTIDLLIKSKERNQKNMSNQFDIYDGPNKVTDAATRCAAFDICITLPEPSDSYVVYDNVNELAWSGPRPTNPPAIAS